MKKGIIHKIIINYFLAILVLPLTLSSTPVIDIQVNQPGTIILSVQLETVWIDANGLIQSLPQLKSFKQPNHPSIPYVSETLVGVPSSAIVNIFPGDERTTPILTNLQLGIHESPKGMELEDNEVITSYFQEQNQIASLYSYPDIKGRQSSGLKVFPISIGNENVIWYEHLMVQITWNPEDPSFIPIMVSKEGFKNIIPKLTSGRTMIQIPNYQYSENLVKIIVDTTRWYKVTRNDLETHGVTLGNVNPVSFQLWNEIEEILLFIDGEEDGEFDYEDEIIFRGEKNPAPVNAPYQNNFYTDENVYWLTWGSENGLRYGQENAYPSEDVPDWNKPIYFTQTVHIEKDEYFARLGQVTEKLHQQWDSFDHFFMNPPVNNGTSVDYFIDLEYPATNEFQITAEVQGITSGTHLITMQWNQHLMGETISWEGQSTKQIHGEAIGNSSIPIVNGENLFTLINQEDSNENTSYDQVYLNWIDISYERFFLTEKEYIRFKSDVNQTGRIEFTVRGFQSNNIYLFKENVARLQDFLISEDDINQTYSIRFQDNIVFPGAEYHVFSDMELDTVKKIIPVDPISTPLNDLVSTYIIVAPDSFHSILEPLVDYHNGEVVSIEEIYRQYSYGKFTPYALKSYFREIFLSNNGSLEAVLIAMQGEDINKEERGFSKGGNFIPSMKIQTVGWGAASSDFWFTCVDGDDLNPEFSIGRFPAEDTEEIQIMVNKTLSYHMQEEQFWHNNQLFIAGYEPVFKEQSETLIGDVVQKGNFPRRLFIDVTSESGPYYGSTETLLNYLETGMSYINFLGHGGGAVWGDRSLMTLAALDHLFNNEKIPFVTSMTCFTGDVTNPNALGRRMVALDQGGAVAWFGSSGVGWIINDFLLLEPLNQYLFGDADLPVGEMIHAAKMDFLASNTTYPDIAKTQVYQFNLTGDPLLRLKKNNTTELQFSPTTEESGQVVNIELTDYSFDSVYFQVFDIENHPIQLEPQLFENSIPLSDSLESGVYYVNISAKSENSLVHDSGIFILTGSDPVIQILNVEPTSATYKDSIYLSVFMNNIQNSDSLFLQINGENYHPIDIGNIQGNTFTEIIPPQDPNRTLILSLRYLGNEGQNFVSNEEIITILPLADYRPISLSFSTEDSIYIKAEIENLYPSPGWCHVYIYQMSENENWTEIVQRELHFTGKETKWIANLFEPLKGVFSYRIITESDDSTLTYANDTLFAIMETQSFYVSENQTVGIQNVDVAVESGDGIIQLINHESVNLESQPDFQIQLVDSIRSALEINAPENLEYEVNWYFSTEISDSLAVYRFYDTFHTWLPESADKSADHVSIIGKGDLTIAFLHSSDGTAPVLEASLNGQKFFKNSYVSSEPLVYINAQDENGIDHRQSGIKIWLNESDMISPSQITGNGNELSIQLKPQLTHLDSSLHVLVSDAWGNWSDTLDLTFTVKTSLELIDYGNFPNPFENRTWFSYELTDACDDFYLDLFTVNGKRIRRFTTGSTDRDLESGAYHEILWDGRDDSGELVANGVYFYRMVGFKDDITLESIGKVAKAK